MPRPGRLGGGRKRKEDEYDVAQKEEGAVEAHVDLVAQQTRHHEYHFPKKTKQTLFCVDRQWPGSGRESYVALNLWRDIATQGLLTMFEVEDAVQRIDGPPLCHPYPS